MVLAVLQENKRQNYRQITPPLFSSNDPFANIILLTHPISCYTTMHPFSFSCSCELDIYYHDAQSMEISFNSVKNQSLDMQIGSVLITMQEVTQFLSHNLAAIQILTHIVAKIIVVALFFSNRTQMSLLGGNHYGRCIY